MNQRIRFRRVSRLWTMAALAVMAWPGLIAAQEAAPKPGGKDDEAKAKTAEEAKDEPGFPASLAGFSDEGVFNLFVNETRLVTSHFTWRLDGRVTAKSTLSVAGQTLDMNVSISVDDKGLWTSMSGKVQVGPFSVKREGEVLHRTIRDKTATLKLKPSTRLFENFTPPLISQAVRLYDRKKAGKQAFPLFILPMTVVQASLELIDTVERSVGGRDMTFHRYTYALPGVDMTVWADDEGRFYFGDVPAQHAAYVREGYESLRAAEESDPLLSRPTFAIKEQRGVSIPMRDGVNLSTDIFLPEGGGKFPVILVRTPYKKEMSELQGQYYARRGFAMAIQDCRGRFASGGTWEPFVHEPKDGYDTIEWLAKQPWSTGKVGMIGASYLGWVQWWAASQRPPHLVTIIPNVSPPDPFYNIPYEYGVFFMLGSIWWADILETEATADISGAAISKIGDKKYHKLLSALPVVELDKAVLGKVNPYWRKWIDHPSNDDYWQRASFLDRLRDVRIPVFHQSGWFDGDGIGAKLNYLRMRSHGHPHQKLVLGPWGHTAQATRLIGERDFGSSAIIDLQRAYLRWFDHWLKGVDNGIDNEPLVSIFTMGSNKWLHGDVYPLPQTRFEKWYLASDGSANTSNGDGRLTREAPPPDAPPDRYSYNPGHPTPMPDFYEEPEDETEGKPDKDAPDKKASGKESSVERKRKRVREYHEKITSARSDILVYTSEPLKEPLTFAGPLSATLFAASSARDTDWFVRLMEVDEKGEFFPLAEGKIRARFRRSMRKPELLTPDKVEQYDLDLWQTGITIPAGRRLRVEVASASFPLFSRNLNTGGHNEKETRYVVAEQTIHHSARYPSHILLPVIPDAARTDATTNHR